MNKYDKALQMCTGDCYWAEKPRPHGEYIYATDTHILLRIKKHLCSEEYSAHDKQPKDLSRVVPQANTSLLLNIVEVGKIINAIELPKKIRVDCEDCDGHGEVDWTYEDLDGEEHYHRDDCPVCHGTGKVDREGSLNDMNIAINGIIFNCGLLILLLNELYKLGFKTATVTYLKANSSMRINVNEDIDAVIMSNNACEASASITLEEK